MNSSKYSHIDPDTQDSSSNHVTNLQQIDRYQRQPEHLSPAYVAPKTPEETRAPIEHTLDPHLEPSHTDADQRHMDHDMTRGETLHGGMAHEMSDPAMVAT